MHVPRDAVVAEVFDVGEFVDALNIQQYGQFAILTLVIYDAVSTCSKEVEFFWEASTVNSVTVVFFLNRYVGIFGAIVIIFWNFYNMTEATCQFTLWTDNICGSITMAAVEYILLLRVLALYTGHRWFSVSIVTLYCLTATAKFVLSIYGSWAQRTSTMLIAEGHTLCNVDSFPPMIISLIDWSIPSAFGMILMVLAVTGAAMYWKARAGFSGSKLVMVLVRDQVVYFVLVLSCSICNILLIEVPLNRGLMYFLQMGGSPYILSVLGNRMLFNLKKAGKRGFNTGTSYRPKSLTVMEFELSALSLSQPQRQTDSPALNIPKPIELSRDHFEISETPR